jgi:hypothetical protein
MSTPRSLCSEMCETFLVSRIHINQHIIRKNKKEGTRDPVITIKQSRGNSYAHEVEVTGPCRVVYRPDNPLPCGAQVWIETESDIHITDPDR